DQPPRRLSGIAAARAERAIVVDRAGSALLVTGARSRTGGHAELSAPTALFLLRRARGVQINVARARRDVTNGAVGAAGAAVARGGAGMTGVRADAGAHRRDGGDRPAARRRGEPYEAAPQRACRDLRPADIERLQYQVRPTAGAVQIFVVLIALQSQ